MPIYKSDMRKIVGPTRSEDGYWRIKTNQEINDIIKDKIQLGLLGNKD